MARTEGFLRGAVGPGDLDNYPEDVIATKKRLRELGFYEPPPEGFGDDIDAGLDKAVREFQKEHGLKVDGYLEPGGETERNVEAARTGRGFDPGPSPLRLVLRGSVGDGGDNDPQDVALVKRAFGATGRYAYDRTRPPSSYVDPKLVEAVTALQRENDLFDSGRIGRDDETIRALRRTIAEHRRNTSPQDRRRRLRPGETEVALGPAALPLLYGLAFGARVAAPHIARGVRALGGMLGGAAAGQAAIEAGKRQGEKYQAIDAPPPNTPPFPAEPRDPKDNREEFPADGPKLPDRTEFPLKIPRTPQILIFPDLSDQLPQSNVVHSDRGNDDTKTQILDVQLHLKRHHSELKHLDGGYNVKDVDLDGDVPSIYELNEVKERAVSGPGVAFLDAKGKRGDGRPGSRFPDLLYEAPGKKLIAFNTVDVDENGKPTDRELQAAESLRRQGITVYLIPKTHQLKKRRKK